MTIAEPDPRWAEAGRLAVVVLAPLFVAVEHIGSTAVPGLAAQPVIDLIAAAVDLDEVNDDALLTLGYRSENTDLPDRLFYWREDYDSLRYQLHVVPAGTWADAGERLLRDYLRTHPELHERYVARKRELMDRFGPTEEYTAGKSGLVLEMTEAARKDR
ncbi:GrpB family protein [Actinoplanes sp. NPDC051494]|uniref:GrpB family protein n=1 Tax=Actinoplanes sp. NPDC051494 TaxID=3363907 RepID=UPI00379FE2FC